MGLSSLVTKGLTACSGRATNINFGSDIAYEGGGQYGAIATKIQVLSMRVDGKPVLFKSKTLPSVSEGDQVAAAGADKNGTLEALALRNLTSGGFYYPPAGPMAIAIGVVAIVVGIPLIAACGIGLVSIGGGAFLIYRIYRHRAAIALVELQSAAGAVRVAKAAGMGTFLFGARGSCVRKGCLT